MVVFKGKLNTKNPPRVVSGWKPATYRPQAKTVRRINKNTRKLRQLVRVPRLRGLMSAYSKLDPFKPTFNCKLTYSEDLFNATTPSTNLYGTDKIYRLNSLYDTDETSTGHQPYGYDQISPLYKKYKVNAALVEVTFYNPSEDGMSGAIQIVPPSGTGNLVGKTLSQIRERPMAATCVLNNSGSQRKTLKQYVPMASVFNISKMAYMTNNVDYSAVVTANPNEMARLQIAIAGSNGTSATVSISVKITYYVTFFERVIQAQS